MYVLYVYIYARNHICMYLYSPEAPQITIGFEEVSYTFTESDGSGRVKVVASQPNVDTFASVAGGVYVQYSTVQYSIV